ncbi:MAG: hypothetical protein ACOY3Y_12035 [Acidobacteriota bacterium]
MHLIGAIVAAAFLAAGIFGLGTWLGGVTVGDRTVRGWTALWWATAMFAQFAGVHAGALVGLFAAGLGVIGVGVRWKSERAAISAGLGILLLAAPLWLLPIHFYDTLAYHLGLPWSWLANGSFAAQPHVVYSRFPLAASVVFLLPSFLGVPEAAAGVHALTCAAALATCLSIARRLGAGRWAAAAPGLLLACWHLVFVGTVAAADGVVLLGALVAVERLVAGQEETRLPGVAVGLALGLALAAKYTAFIPVAAVLAALALCGRPLQALASGAVALAASSFWWLRNVIETGNPLFPLFWSVLGGAGWTAADQAKWEALVREGAGQSLDPGAVAARLVVPPDGLGWWVALAAVPALVAVIRPPGHAVRSRLVALAAALMAVGWVATSQTTRYAMPLAALLAVLAAVGTAAMSVRPRLFVAAGLGLGVALGAASLGSFLFGTLGVHRVWLGETTAEDWRRTVTVSDPLPAYHAAARQLPPGSRLLLVGEGRPHGCPLPHHASSAYDRQLVERVAAETTAPGDVARRLRAMGFTHAVVNHGELRRLAGGSYRVLRPADRAQRERLEEFFTRHTTVIWDDDGLEIRSIDTPG